MQALIGCLHGPCFIVEAPGSLTQWEHHCFPKCVTLDPVAVAEAYWRTQKAECMGVHTLLESAANYT
jgi:hypothetical protein